MNRESYETIRFETAGRVATITLHRPERHNAFNRTMALELRDAWQRVRRDPGIVSVVLTGAGREAFCTGVDLGEAAADRSGEPAPAPDDVPYLHMTAVQNRCWKPVITAVNGMVVAGGFHFIADSDLVIAAEHATFFDTHVRVGLVAGLEPVALARRIPLEAALRLALLGGQERMTAEQALRCGLVGEILPGHRLLARAHELAEKIARNSPTALARSKRCVWEGLDRGLHEALRHAWRLIEEHRDHPDAREGGRAFLEKRPPRWAPYDGNEDE